MYPKRSIIVIVLCIASFLLGFVVAPVYNTFRSWDYRKKTNSASVHTSEINIDI